MAHALVDVDAFDAAVTVPDDTDAASAASVGTPFQSLANRTAFVRARVPGAAASYQVVIPAYFTGNLAARFAYEPAGGGNPRSYPINADVTSTGGIWCPVGGLPSKGTITAFDALVTGLETAGAHAGLVGTAPAVGFYRRQLSTGAIAAVATTNDPHATTSLVAYEAPHTIPSGVLAESLSADKAYYAIVTGEGGANATADKFSIQAFVVTITP